MKKNNQPNHNIPSRGQPRRENPMRQINNALNNYAPPKRLYDKYGKFANYGPDGPISGPNYREPSNPSSKNQSTSKSAFLLSHYPDGNGPDAELIEMLEREVVDINPNVKFEDIAE